MKLFRNLTLALISFILVCSVQANGKNSTDESFRKKLVGVWLIEHTSPHFSVNGEVNLLANGSFNTWADFVFKGKGVKPIRYKGVWEVKNGILIETITETNIPGEVGKVTEDEILRVDDREFEFKHSSGSVIIRKRKVTSNT